MNKRETDIQQPIEIIERSSISKGAEVSFSIKNIVSYEVVEG